MKKLILILIILLFGTTTFAQTMAGRKILTLDECLEISRKNNPDIQLTESKMAAAEARLMNGFGNYLPSLNLYSSFSRKLNVEGASNISVGGQTITLPGETPNSFNVQASLSWVIFDGFNREGTYSGAKNRLKAEELNTEQTIFRTEYLVKSKFFEVVRNMKIVNTREKDLNASRKQLEMIRAQYEVGTVPVTNVYTQETEISNKELNVINAQRNFETSRAELLILLNINPESDIDFDESSVPAMISNEEVDEYRKDIGGLNSCINTGLKNRLDLTSLDYSQLAADDGISTAKSSYYPTLNASGSWNSSGTEMNQIPDNGRAYLGLSLSVPIFNNFRTNYLIENAKLQYAEVETQKIKLEKEVMSSIKSAYISLEASEKQLEIANKALKSSEMNFESISERFKVGASNITDYVLANTTYLNAQLNLTNSVYNYLLSKIALQYFMGLE